MLVNNEYINTKLSYNTIAENIWSDFTAWKSGKDVNLIIDDLVRELDKNLTYIKLRNRYNLLNKITFFLLSPFISRKFFLIIVLILRSCFTKSAKNKYLNFREFGLCKEINISYLLDFTNLTNKGFVGIKNQKINSLYVLNLFYSYIKSSIKSRTTKLFIEDRLLYEFIHNDSYFNAVVKFILYYAKLKKISVSSVAVNESLFFLKENFIILIDIIPNKEKVCFGFAKMLKVMIGVLFYKIAFLSRHHESELVLQDDELINIVKTAYYWGITYPLIDDVIDSDVFTIEEKLDYFNILKSLFSDSNDYNSNLFNKHTFVAYLLESWTDFKKIKPYNCNKELYITLLLALESHIVDSQKRNNNISFINIILKASLVRVSTALISELPVSNDILQNIFLMSFYNQQEDDMADILEDIDSKHATPFSQFVKLKEIENPFSLFIQYMYYIYHVSNNDLDIKKILVLNLLEMIKNLKKEKGKYEYLEREIFHKMYNEKLSEKLQMISKHSAGIEDVDLEYAIMPFLSDCVKYYISKHEKL